MVEMRRVGRVAVVALALLGMVVLALASPTELPLLPPVDRPLLLLSHARAADSGHHSSSPSQVHLLMIRLIRNFFGDQVKWGPFSDFRRRDQVVHTHHHRIVHEHRPHHSNRHDELAKRRFRLRGWPIPTSPDSNQ